MSSAPIGIVVFPGLEWRRGIRAGHDAPMPSALTNVIALGAASYACNATSVQSIFPNCFAVHAVLLTFAIATSFSAIPFVLKAFHYL
jgi:hypothetical protein